MTRAGAILAAALLAATLAAAQDASTTRNAFGPITVKGCLSGSALADNAFKLTADNGHVYDLKGDTAQLISNVGHEVEITGQVSLPTSSAAAGSHANSGNNPERNVIGEKEPANIQVKGVCKLSDQCKSAAPPGPAAMVSPNSSTGTLVRVSMQTTEPGTQGSAPNSAANNSSDAQRGNLPTTATFLPLLGLLGLGSLVAGFLVRH